MEQHKHSFCSWVSDSVLTFILFMKILRWEDPEEAHQLIPVNRINQNSRKYRRQME